MPNIQLQIEIDSSRIVVFNVKGKSKTFPRCGITKFGPFLNEMAKEGYLDELLIDY